MGITKDGAITGGMSSGGTWSSISVPGVGGDQTVPNLASGYIDVCDSQKGVCWPRSAVAYESSSGDALIVWGDKNKRANRLRYSVWNGSSWTTANGVPGYTGGEPLWMQIASKPGYNEIVVAIADGDDNVDLGGSTVDYVVVWDGDNDEWGDVLELDSSGSNYTEQPSISVAYESQRVVQWS